MTEPQANNPLHGKTLESILTSLVSTTAGISSASAST